MPFLDRLQQSAEGWRLARGIAWSLAGGVASRGLALFASVIAARILGKTAFGELGIIQSTTNMYGALGQFGGQTAIKHVAEFRKIDPERAGRMIAMSIIVAVASGACVGALMIASAAWAAQLLAAPHLRIAIAISALALMLILINGTLEGVLSGFEAFKRQSTVQVAVATASLPISVLSVYFFGLIGAVWGLIVFAALLVLLNLRAVKKEMSLAGISIRWRDARQEIAILKRFSLPALCSGVLYMPSTWVANMILVNGPNGYAEMGIFNAADRWRTAILFLPSLLGAVSLPMLSRLRGEAATRRYHKLLWATITLSVFASIAVATPVVLWAPWIMARFGPGFAEGTWVLITLCATSVAFAPYWIVGRSAVSRGHVWTTFIFNLGWAVTLLTSAWLWRGDGAKGLADAYLIAEMARLTAALAYASKMRSLESS